MKRIAASVVGLLIIALIIWRCSGTSKPAKLSGSAAQGVVAGHIAAGSAADRAAPPWFAPRGVSARKIAGRVTLRGAPVKDAAVTLQSMLSRANVVPPVEARTGADGTFDFGMRPPAQYDVTAFSPGTVAAIVHIDVADPTLKPPPDHHELRLLDCTASVEGKILDASGNPLPKVHVRQNGVVGVDADAKGAYKLCVPWGDVELEYSADGFGSVMLTINARGDIHRDVVLVPDVTITVRAVRRDDGQAVPGAYIFVAPQEWGPDRAAGATAVTGADGSVRVDGLLPGRYRVFGFADGLQASSPADVLAEVGVPTEAVVVLDATARISGKVMAGDKPIAGAQVMAIRKSPVGRSPAAVSQLDGSFVLDRVPVGDLLFTAPPFEVNAPKQFETKAGKSYDNVVIDVHALGAIRGTVTRLGKPIAGIDVCCVPTVQPAEARTDADGHYEFRGVAAGKYGIQAGADEVGAFTLGEKITLAAGEERVLDLELDMAGTIAGVVVDKSGEPVKGVFVRWLHEQTGDVGRSMTDAQGRYRCGAMTGGGKYRAAVFPAAGMRVPYPTADGAPYPTLEVKDGKTVIEGVKLAIDRPQLSISGRVVDDSGAPVADAIVKALPTPGDGPPQFHSWLRLPLTSTDADGQFAINELAPGNYALQARGADGAEGMAPPIAAGTKGVTIRVERPASIEGKLVGYTQSPSVYARSLSEFRFTPGTVEGATFRIAGMRPGRYLVNAQTTYEGDAQMVELRAGQIAKVVLTSHGRGVVEGTLLDFRTRNPIAGASCMAVMAVDGEQAMTSWDINTAAKTDARGHFVLDPAPAGNVSLRCEMPSFRWSRASAEATVTAGARTTVQLLSVEQTLENGSNVGIAFSWLTVPPRVFTVVPNSPAAKAGVLVGDLVTQVNGVSVQGLNGPGVQNLLESVPVGGDVRIVVIRAGSTKTFAMKAVADGQ